VEFSNAAQLPTAYGVFQIQAVKAEDGDEHLLVIKGAVEGRDEVPVRIHSECTTSSALHSLRCDCDEQLIVALDYFEAQGSGLLIYLRQEGRGIGLFNKIEAYALQDVGLDTVEANAKLGFPIDLRSYELPCRVIERLSIKSIRLLTNNPLKLAALENFGVTVSERIPIHVSGNEFNRPYLDTKREKMEHLL
jgi:GTP cyclohydrolase II